MSIKVRVRFSDESETLLMKLAGLSALAHVAGLILFSILPRFMAPPPSPRTTIATIVPASALFPRATAPAPRATPSGPTPSERAEAARKALEKKPAPPPVKPVPKKPESKKPQEAKPRPRQDETVPPLETKQPEEAPPPEPQPEGGSAMEAGDAAAATEREPGGISFGPTGDAPGGIPSIGSSAFPYDYYRSSLVALLQSNWRRPVAPAGLSQTYGCRVRFTILKSGIIQEPRIVAPSGNPALDQSALRAVYDSNPLPPLPFQYGQSSVSAEVLFELTPD